MNTKQLQWGDSNSTSVDDLVYRVIGCIIEVFHMLGPGLLESVYEKALMIELRENGLNAMNQIPLSVEYKGVNIGEGLRLDILVEDELIVELKSVDELKGVHYKQLQTYLKLYDKPMGILVNFNEKDIMTGIHRVSRLA